MNCRKTFKPKNNQQKYCCQECKYQYSRNHKFVTVKCVNCGKDITKHRDNIKKNINNYYCDDCRKDYQHKQFYEYRKCEICDKKFEVRKSSKQKICSRECQNQWQTTRTGKSNPKYKDTNIACDYCGKIFHISQYKLKNNSKHFCSKKCTRTWYSEIYSQSDEWKLESVKRTVKMLENGDFSHTNTSIQIKINDILNNLKINYINEKGFVNCAVDNYLIDYNLVLECMGQYWHCDNRKYKEINYVMQVNRIKMDKIKHSNLLNNYGINILYLWEKDINENPMMCELLIQEYIKNHGILQNYHSFNYKLNSNQLIISNNVIIPYMDWDINDLHKIINISVKNKMSHKQEDKWTKYNCEVCDKECEQLTSHYNKSKSHCCSYECANIKQINKIKLICSQCKKEFDMIPSNYEKRKNKDEIFCSRKCQVDYGFINFNCEHCGKITRIKKRDYRKSKHHYCSKECFFLNGHSKDGHHPL